MYAHIVALETRLKGLHPAKRLNQSPGKEQVETARAWSAAIWKAAKQVGPMVLSAEMIDQGKRLSQRPLFICGVHRSGTTLIRDLLDSHPSLSVLPSEGTFLTNIAPKLKYLQPDAQSEFLATEWLRRLVNPINQPPYWLLGESSETASLYIDFARAFIAWSAIAKQEIKNNLSPHLAIVLAYATVTNSLNAAYWVDKTPTQERYLPQILKDFPETKVIHIVRDPHDTFRSRLQMEPGLNVTRCLKDMAFSYQSAIVNADKHPGSYLVLKYEDLCEAPADMMQIVANFLNIEMQQQLLTATVSGKPTQANSSFHTNLPAGDVVKAHRHRSGTSLSAKQDALLSAWLFKEAGQWGYHLNTMPGWKRVLLKVSPTQTLPGREGFKKSPLPGEI